MLKLSTFLDPHEKVQFHITRVYPRIPSTLAIRQSIPLAPHTLLIKCLDEMTHLTVFLSNSFLIPPGVIPFVFRSSQFCLDTWSNPT